MNTVDHAPIKSQAGVILDAVLHGRPDIAASIIADGIAFYTSKRPIEAMQVKEYAEAAEHGKKRATGPKNGKRSSEPKARKPRASKARKAEVSP